MFPRLHVYTRRLGYALSESSRPIANVLRAFTASKRPPGRQVPIHSEKINISVSSMVTRSSSMVTRPSSMVSPSNLDDQSLLCVIARVRARALVQAVPVAPPPLHSGCLSPRTHCPRRRASKRRIPLRASVYSTRGANGRSPHSTPRVQRHARASPFVSSHTQTIFTGPRQEHESFKRCQAVLRTFSIVDSLNADLLIGAAGTVFIGAGGRVDSRSGTPPGLNLNTVSSPQRPRVLASARGLESTLRSRFTMGQYWTL